MGDFERPLSAQAVGSRQGSLQGTRLSDPYRHWLTGDLAHFSTVAWVGFALFMGLAAIAMFVVGTWIFDDEQPIHFISAEAVPDSGKPGAVVMTNYTVEVVRDAHTCAPGKTCPQAACTIEGERSWIDSDGREWPSTTVHLGYNKGHNIIGLSMVIPANAADGEAWVNNGIVWSCDPFRLVKHKEPMPPLAVIVQR